MRIISWNVNGLRACVRKGFLDWLAKSEGHIVGLQEVRARSEQLSVDAREPEGFHTAFFPAERPGYSGVGFYARTQPDELITTMGQEEFDAEGRMQLARWGKLWVANVYFPNGSGKNRDNSRIPFKLSFYRRLFEMLEERRQAGEPVLVLGDFNTAHRDIDLARPRQNRETSGFRPEEREELDRWLEAGWVDTFRHFHPDQEGMYSWWSNRAGVRERNVGWRIDYILASEGALPFIRDGFILTDVMGSDHCPIGVEVGPELFT